jgi:hypothetical protein
MEHASHPENRIATVPWAAAMRRASTRLDVDPCKTLVSHRDLKVGRFRHDGSIRGPSGDQRIRADAGVLLVNYGRDHETSTLETALCHHASRIDHCRNAALHVLRATAVEAPLAHIGNERCLHAVDADSIDVPAEHQRLTRLPAFEHSDHIRSPGCDGLHLDIEAGRTHAVGEDRRDLSLSLRARHERWIDGVN